jgi:hypothetical protein
MHSSWSITYFGHYSGVMIKKLERVGIFSAHEVERERFLIHDEKIEHASFLVEHDSKDWPTLVMDTFSIARRLIPEWRILLTKDSIRGSIGDVLNAYEPGYKLPVSGIRSIQWEINRDQKYTRMRLLSGQPDRW